MLESIALRYVASGLDYQRGIAAGVFIAGVLLGFVFRGRKARLMRAPHFAYLSITLLGFVLAQAVWLLWQPASTFGFLWLLVLVDLGASAVAGFILARTAISRSRDAFGHGWWAPLSFIPALNLVLLFKRSKPGVDGEQAGGALMGREGVFIGFLALAGAVFANIVIPQEVTSELSQQPTAQQDQMALLLRANGLEATLRTIAESAETPISLGNGIQITRVAADGETLRRDYVVDMAFFVLTDGIRNNMIRSICSEAHFGPLLRAGARIQDVVRMSDGRYVGEVSVSLKDCEPMSSAM